MQLHWPQNWDELVSGATCPMCEEGRPDETSHAARFFAGRVTDAYLQREDVQRGYTIVVWRGRHVVDLIQLSGEERAAYWTEVVTVARALEEAFHPKKMNYMTLGNWVPHLHTHLIPRYDEDPAPGRPFPLPLERQPDVPHAQFRADLQRLQQALLGTESHA
jgi:diadenosine tetraphosphate (Ap4A) HIT family hydrolase